MSGRDDTLYERLRELLDVAFLLSLTVGIIGAGRAGASNFYHLLKYPWKKIKIVDFDMVEAKDLGNLYPLKSLGKHKVVALAESAEAWNPLVSIEFQTMKITREKIGRLVDWMGECDIIFFALDDTGMFEELVRAFHSTKLIVASVATQQAACGMIAWSASRQTSCVECALGISTAAQGQGRPSLPSDFDVIQNYAVQVGIGLLLNGKKGYELFSGLIHPDFNLLLVFNRENAGNASKTPEIPKGVQLLQVKTSCPICRRRG